MAIRHLAHTLADDVCGMASDATKNDIMWLISDRLDIGSMSDDAAHEVAEAIFAAYCTGFQRAQLVLECMEL